MQYDHTQKAPQYLIIAAAGIGMLVGAWFVPDQPAQIILACSGVLTFVVAASFRQLTVRDEGDHLLVQYGPLPLFRRRVPYFEIERVERGRTSPLEGWGIRLSLRGGWIWNLWGLDCVVVHLTRGRTLRIGTDEPERLEAFLTEQIGPRAAHRNAWSAARPSEVSIRAPPGSSTTSGGSAGLTTTAWNAGVGAAQARPADVWSAPAGAAGARRVACVCWASFLRH